MRGNRLSAAEEPPNPLAEGEGRRAVEAGERGVVEGEVGVLEVSGVQVEGGAEQGDAVFLDRVFGQQEMGELGAERVVFGDNGGPDRGGGFEVGDGGRGDVLEIDAGFERVVVGGVGTGGVGGAG